MLTDVATATWPLTHSSSLPTPSSRPDRYGDVAVKETSFAMEESVLIERVAGPFQPLLGSSRGPWYAADGARVVRFGRRVPKASGQPCTFVRGFKSDSRLNLPRPQRWLFSAVQR